MNDRGDYGQPSTSQSFWHALAHPAKIEPWTDTQRKDFQRTAALGTLGSVAGAVLWKEHRVWGFLLGGMVGGAIGNLVFTPPSGLTWQFAK